MSMYIKKKKKGCYLRQFSKSLVSISIYFKKFINKNKNGLIYIYIQFFNSGEEGKKSRSKPFIVEVK